MLIGSVLFLAVAPFLAFRFLEPAVAPRIMLWIYLALLASLFAVVLGLSVFLFLYLAPAALTAPFGTTCVHGTYCLHSLPPWISFALWLPVTGVLVWLVGRMAWSGVVAVWASRRVRRTVLARAKLVQRSPFPVYEVPSEAVLACTAGIRRPVILLSQALRESLTAAEIGVVIAHEEAHARGHDNLILLASRVMADALFFIPSAAKARLGVQRSAEMAADAFASRGTGDSLLVAASVSRVAQLLFGQARSRSLATSNVGAAFGHGDIALARVHRLLDEQPGAPSRRRLVLSIAVLAVVLALFGTSLYWVAEGSLAGDPLAAACVGSALR